MSRVRSFLLLQGVCSPFFLRLADGLKADGHQVHKINFNAGDWLYWGGRSASNYRGRLADLQDFLDQKYRTLGITDQVLFGDCRPVHRPAVAHGQALGIRTHVFEEGYFRPHWVTLERDGVNTHSLLPRDPNWFADVGRRLPAPAPVQPFVSPFRIRAMHDIAYHSAGFWNPVAFPRYRTHAPVSAATEYAGYARRLPMLRYHAPRDDALIQGLLRDATPFYVLPLQLGSDAQIREHSMFNDMAEVIEYVLASFARHAPAQSRLVIKNHPLDIGLDQHARTIRGLAARYDVAGRVDYIETGNLDALLSHARGTVTVNSTVGASSLGLNCPTLALSNPIYHLPGLTFQGTLDDFWRNGTPPDAALFTHFRNTVIHTTQVNGGFYCRDGIALAVAGSRRLLAAERSPLEEWL